MVVSSHESLDWWGKMSPVFEDYLAESHFCDVWFVCSDRIVPAHKLVLAQLGNWNKRTGTLLDWLESDETFITVDDWTGDQVTQILIEIYNTETKELGSETKLLMKCLGIKFEDDELPKEDKNSNSQEETGEPKLKRVSDVFYSDDDESSIGLNLEDESETHDIENDTASSVVVTESNVKNTNVNLCGGTGSSYPHIGDETDSIVVTGLVC